VILYVQINQARKYSRVEQILQEYKVHDSTTHSKVMRNFLMYNWKSQQNFQLISIVTAKMKKLFVNNIYHRFVHNKILLFCTCKCKNLHNFSIHLYMTLIPTRSISRVFKSKFFFGWDRGLTSYVKHFLQALLVV